MELPTKQQLGELWDRSVLRAVAYSLAGKFNHVSVEDKPGLKALFSSDVMTIGEREFFTYLDNKWAMLTEIKQEDDREHRSYSATRVKSPLLNFIFRKYDEAHPAQAEIPAPAPEA